MLVDKLRIDFTAGKGGNGCVSFVRIGRTLGENGKLYYPQKGKPDGGNGGKGGDIYLEGSTDLYSLASFSHNSEFTSEDGQDGYSSNKQGKSGKDIIIKVPLVTIVTDTQGNRVMSVKRDGERKLLARGGIGGLGNYNFREGQVNTLTKHTNGEPGQKLKVFFELRLAADVIFIGFPNAGKSSMLNSLTNAKVKVASYPFTTITPQLGVMSGKLKLMDLPGLVEGVAEGKGLGKSFSRHTILAKLMAHFISLESEDVEKDYLAIRKELEAFSHELIEKRELIILTKSDMFDESQIDKKVESLDKYDKEIVVTSIYDDSSVLRVENRFKEIIHELTTYDD